MVNKKAGFTLFLQLKDDIEISVTPGVITLIEGGGMRDLRNILCMKIEKKLAPILKLELESTQELVR